MGLNLTLRNDWNVPGIRNGWDLCPEKRVFQCSVDLQVLGCHLPFLAFQRVPAPEDGGVISCISLADEAVVKFSGNEKEDRIPKY